MVNLLNALTVPPVPDDFCHFQRRLKKPLVGESLASK